MTVKELIEKLEEFEPNAKIAAGDKHDNPTTEYASVIDVYEIKGSNRDDINGVMIITG